MSNPFFSIIIPTHNGAERIHEAVYSVAQQTFKDWELIVVLDNCIDDTEDAVRKTIVNNFGQDMFDKHVGFKLVNVNSDGLARNAGIDVSKGEWILFLDDDDTFLHEYCLEKLADKLQQVNTDVLDFSFIWKGKGYMDPVPDCQYVMAWCRAWKASFIGDNRFTDIPYGSDKEFYERMILNNPNCTVTFWHFPVYYYNYMREGSMTWNHKKEYKLDIIITHHDEQKDICMKSLDMIALQQNIDFNDICVTLVNTDREYAIETSDVCNYPFKINLMHEFGKTTGEARYYATSNTAAPWIMYCNCDDMFADVCSLSQILSNFPNTEYDILWCKIVQQTAWANGTTYLNCIDSPNFTNTDGKLYRREFLDSNKLFYNEADKYWYDYIFGATTLAAVKPFRIAMVMSDFHLYYKSYRKDSLRHDNLAVNNTINHVDLRDAKILRELVRLRKDDIVDQHQVSLAVARFLTRQFCTVYEPATQNKDDVVIYNQTLVDTYREYKEDFDKLGKADVDVVLDEVETEVSNFIQQVYNEHRRELYFLNDEVTFDQWIEKLNFIIDASTLQEIIEPELPKKQKRVAVYFGTRNVYENMVASAKSLLYNTPIDKILFFIEDEHFPQDLPGCIGLIDVSNTKALFDNSPNFDNAWTYMCLMRATLPGLADVYDKVLSLDVDTVITEDISELFNIDMENYYLAGVKETQRTETCDYINFGVVMMNLKKLLHDSKEDDIIHLLNTQKLDCPEQTAFNRVCTGHILLLPSDYNHTVYSHITGDSEHPKILHYAGQKFWKHYAPVKKYADMSWEEVMKRQNELKGVDTNA